MFDRSVGYHSKKCSFTLSLLFCFGVEPMVEFEVCGQYFIRALVGLRQDRMMVGVISVIMCIYCCMIYFEYVPYVDVFYI